MPKRSESLLEKLKLGQQGWNEVLSRNAQRLNDILLKVDGLLDVDITDIKTGDVLWWNASNQKFENVNKAYAISAASVSSASSESSELSISSETVSSESSESSESSNSSDSESSQIVSGSSSSESSESSESSFSCGELASDQTFGETFDASNYYSTFVPANAFDNNNSTMWIVDTPAVWEWIEVEFALSKAIMQLRVRSANIGWENTPTRLELRASGNGNFVGEETVVFQTPVLTWSQNEWKTFQFGTVVDVDYYRLYVNGSLSQYNIAEIEMMECNDYSISSESSSSDSSVSSETISSISSESSQSLCGVGWTSQLNLDQSYDASENSAYARSAFDGLYYTYWLSNIVPGTEWIQIEFDIAKRVRRYGRYNYSPYSEYHPRRMRLRASNDPTFTSYVELHDTGIIAWAGGQTQYFEFDNDTDYLYYRFYCSNPLNNGYIYVSHIHMYECVEDSESSSSSESSAEGTLLAAEMASGGDDGRATMSGSSYSSTGAYNSFGDISGIAYRSFFRFQLTGIENAANIEKCFLRFRSNDGYVAIPVNLNIHIEDKDNTTKPTSGADLVNETNHPLSSAVSWDNAGTWITDGQYDTPDLSSILQGVINKAGWNDGQWVTFHILDDGTAYRDYVRGVRSFDNNPDKAPELYIRFAGGSDSSSSESSETISSTSSISSESSLSSETISSTSSESSDSSDSSESSVSATIFSKQIAVSADDGWSIGATFYPTTGPLYIGYAGGVCDSYYLFTNITIPKNTIPISAVLRFTASGSDSGDCDNNIYIEDADNPIAPTTEGDFNGRVLSSPVAWDNVVSYTAESLYDTIDFSDILETHLARDNWPTEGGNSLMVIIKDNSSSGYRRVYSRTDSATKQAKLIVEYID